MNLKSLEKFKVGTFYNSKATTLVRNQYLSVIDIYEMKVSQSLKELLPYIRSPELNLEFVSLTATDLGLADDFPINIISKERFVEDGNEENLSELLNSIIEDEEYTPLKINLLPRNYYVDTTGDTEIDHQKNKKLCAVFKVTRKETEDEKALRLTEIQDLKMVFDQKQKRVTQERNNELKEDKMKSEIINLLGNRPDLVGFINRKL